MEGKGVAFRSTTVSYRWVTPYVSYFGVVSFKTSLSLRPFNRPSSAGMGEMGWEKVCRGWKRGGIRCVGGGRRWEERGGRRCVGGGRRCVGGGENVREGWEKVGEGSRG